MVSVRLKRILSRKWLPTTTTETEEVRLSKADMRFLRRLVASSLTPKGAGPSSAATVKLLKKHGIVRKHGVWVKAGYGPYPPRPMPKPDPIDVKPRTLRARKYG